MGHTPHRKRVQHIERVLQARFLTFSCYRRRPLLSNDERLAIVGAAIDRALRVKGWVLLAWVLMPDHVHIVAVPWYGASDASAVLYAIKRPSSFRIKQALLRAGDPLAAELTIRERPGKLTFRFWQEGPGYDENVETYGALAEIIQYVHNNPVRRGLCEKPTDWPWSSAPQWAGIEPDERLPRVVRWSDAAGLLWDGPEAWFGADRA